MEDNLKYYKRLLDFLIDIRIYHQQDIKSELIGDYCIFENNLDNIVRFIRRKDLISKEIPLLREYLNKNIIGTDKKLIWKSIIDFAYTKEFEKIIKLKVFT